jgi:hypothetical protein
MNLLDKFKDDESDDPLKGLDAQPTALTALRLMREPNLPVSLHAINQLSDGAKQRFYRILVSPELLVRFGINPITWRGRDGDGHVRLTAEADSHTVKLSARHTVDARDPFAYLELADNAFNGIDVELVVFNDPESPRFHTDTEIESGRETLFGTLSRNLAAEEQAMAAGLAPGQVRQGLRTSRSAMQNLESFLCLLGHTAFYVEPLTYADAWIFEQRGFAYVSGRRLMDEIHTEFQPGGRLHSALDGSTPFRQPHQWLTVRGRSWAIHDGILDHIGASWNGLRMAKQLGHEAGEQTFPDALY